MPTTIGGVAGSGGSSYGVSSAASKNMQELSSQSFLELIAKQLSNQDFMNPVDDTQFLAQMAQFTTMQQTQEMANLFKQSYVLSLVGRNITAAKYTTSGEMDTVTGVVTKVSLLDNEYLIYIGEKSFSLEEIMSLNADGTTGPGLPTEKPKTLALEESQQSLLHSWMEQMAATQPALDLGGGSLAQTLSTYGLSVAPKNQWHSPENIDEAAQEQKEFSEGEEV